MDRDAKVFWEQSNCSPLNDVHAGGTDGDIGFSFSCVGVTMSQFENNPLISFRGRRGGRTTIRGRKELLLRLFYDLTIELKSQCDFKGNLPFTLDEKKTQSVKKEKLIQYLEKERAGIVSVKRPTSAEYEAMRAGMLLTIASIKHYVEYGTFGDGKEGEGV